MDEIKYIKEEIAIIKARNKKVEADKAWEISLFRKVLIAFLTYFTFVIFFISVDFQKPFINALVPTLAYFISTLSIPFFKKIWERYFF